jgi:hypothetical protein
MDRFEFDLQSIVENLLKKLFTNIHHIQLIFLIITQNRKAILNYDNFWTYSHVDTFLESAWDGVDKAMNDSKGTIKINDILLAFDYKIKFINEFTKLEKLLLDNIYSIIINQIRTENNEIFLRNLAEILLKQNENNEEDGNDSMSTLIIPYLVKQLKSILHLLICDYWKNSCEILEIWMKYPNNDNYIISWFELASLENSYQKLSLLPSNTSCKFPFFEALCSKIDDININQEESLNEILTKIEFSLDLPIDSYSNFLYDIDSESDHNLFGFIMRLISLIGPKFTELKEFQKLIFSYSLFAIFKDKKYKEIILKEENKMENIISIPLIKIHDTILLISSTGETSRIEEDEEYNANDNEFFHQDIDDEDIDDDDDYDDEFDYDEEDDNDDDYDSSESEQISDQLLTEDTSNINLNTDVINHNHINKDDELVEDISTINVDVINVDVINDINEDEVIEDISNINQINKDDELGEDISTINVDVSNDINKDEIVEDISNISGNLNSDIIKEIENIEKIDNEKTNNLTISLLEENTMVINESKKEANDVLENIRSIWKPSRDNNPIYGLLDRILSVLSKDIAGSETHYFFEILQNFDDNSYHENEIPIVKVIQSNDGLLLCNNEIGFNEDNVRALCNVGESTKKGKLGFIGEKGLGFKSTFSICQSPTLLSGNYSFKFDLDESKDLGFGLACIYPVTLTIEEENKIRQNIPKNSENIKTVIYLPKLLNQTHLILSIDVISLLFFRKIECFEYYSDSNQLEFIWKKDLSEYPLVTLKSRTDRLKYIMYRHHTIIGSQYFTKRKNKRN